MKYLLFLLVPIFIILILFFYNFNKNSKNNYELKNKQKNFNTKNISKDFDEKNINKDSSLEKNINENCQTKENINKDNDNKDNNKDNINKDNDLKYDSKNNFKYEYTFILTKEELKYYEILSETLSSESLKNVDPISIAKIYLFCGINQNWQAEYALLNKNDLDKSLEEWINYNEEEFKKVDIKYIRERAESIASFIDKGNFVEDGNEPYILFYTSNKDKMKFQFVKTEKGILEVSMPPLTYI